MIDLTKSPVLPFHVIPCELARGAPPIYLKSLLDMAKVQGVSERLVLIEGARALRAAVQHRAVDVITPETVPPTTYTASAEWVDFFQVRAILSEQLMPDEEIWQEWVALHPVNMNPSMRSRQ